MAELEPTTAQSTGALSGTIAGRFVISQRLGKGGMGEVYRAEDIKLKRTVALKRLSPRLRDDPAYRQRLVEEAQRVSRFNDPHVAALHDVVEYSDDSFLVMEFVEGETLRRRLAKPLASAEFFRIAIQCAEALKAAHQLGIIHCDIKPENIMLTSAGQVKILDFGVARCLPRDECSTTVDRSGQWAGTPAYMAPEVLLETPPDPRSDLFSLGVVFYEMLTRHHPFLASSFVATADRIRRETPAAISIFNRNAPAGVEAIVRRLLAKEPSQRYASADALIKDLVSLNGGVPTVAAVSGKSRRARPLVSYWKWLALIIAMILSIILGAYYHAHRRPLLAERGWILVTDFDNRAGSTIPDAAVREGLTIALEQSRYVNVFPRSRAYEALQRMEKPDVKRIDEGLGREICRREGLQVLLTGTIEQIGHAFQITVRAVDAADGNLLVAEKERFEREEQFFTKTDELAKNVRKDLGESLGRIETTSRPLAKVTTRSFEALQLYTRANDGFISGQSDQVPALLQSALKLDPDFAMAHLLLAQYYASLVGRNVQAYAELERAYSLRQNVSDREQRRIEAEYFGYQEKYEEQAQSLSVLLSLYPDDVQAHEDLAGAYDGAGEPDKALSELREIARLRPSSPQAQGALVYQLTKRNLFEEAIAVSQAALNRGLDSPRLRWGRGMAYFGEGKLAEARDEFRRVAISGGEFESVGKLCLSRVDIYEGKFLAAQTQLQADMAKEQESQTKGLQLVRREMLGDIAVLLGKPATAQHEAGEIMAGPATDLQTTDYVAAGTLYARTGQFAAAQRVLRELDHLRTTTPSAWNKGSYLLVAGEVALSDNHADEANKLFRSAAAQFPSAAPIIGAARSYESQGDWQNALENWKAALNARGEILEELFPGELAVAHLHLARVYVRLGRNSDAVHEYEEVVSMWRAGDDTPLRRAATRELNALRETAQRQ